MAICLGRRLPDASMQPTRALCPPKAGARRATSPLLLGFAPNGVYRAASVTGTRGGLLPHRFTLARYETEVPSAGGLFSVALSVGLPRLGVTQHSALWSSDFPHSNERDHPARLPHDSECLRWPAYRLHCSETDRRA